MTSVSMIVEKRPLGIESGLGREVLVKRGRELRAELAHRLGIAGLAGWAFVAFVLAMAWGSEAVGTVVVLGLVILPFAGYAAQWGGARGVVEVTVHELGLVRRDGSHSIALAWSELAEVFERASEHDGLFGKELRGAFTFAAHDGRTLVIDERVPDWREVGRTASAMAQEVMTVSYELGLVAQRPLRFGDLVVDGYGIHTTAGVFPWAAVTFVRFERRGHEASWAVHVGAFAVGARIPSDRIANARALTLVLARLGKLDTSAAAVLAEITNVVEAA